ncbi:hypothetical protein HN51_056683 [Arachis hypogaea]
MVNGIISEPHGSWQNCRDDISNCTPDQPNAVQGFREDFIKALGGGAELSIKRNVHRLKRESLEEAVRRETWEETGIEVGEALSHSLNRDSSQVLRIFDKGAQAMQSVRNSRLELENSTAVGETILSSIQGQRECLKSAHRKALDMLNTVGMLNFVLRLIERCAEHSGDDMKKIFSIAIYIHNLVI